MDEQDPRTCENKRLFNDFLPLAGILYIFPFVAKWCVMCRCFLTAREGYFTEWLISIMETKGEHYLLINYRAATTWKRPSLLVLFTSAVIIIFFVLLAFVLIEKIVLTLSMRASTSPRHLTVDSSLILYQKKFLKNLKNFQKIKNLLF